jgi:hypothetical protein
LISNEGNSNTSTAAQQPASTAPPPFIGLTRRDRYGELSAIYVVPADISVIELSPVWGDGARVYVRTLGAKAPLEVQESTDSVLKMIEEHAENAAQVKES